MRASTGWGGSTGAKPKPRPRPSGGGGGGSHGSSGSGGGGGGGRDYGDLPNQGRTPSQWGAPLNYRRDHTTPEKFFEPKPAQQKIPENDWAEVIRQVFRPQDARADKEAAERKAREQVEKQRSDRDEALGDEGKPKVERLTWHEYNMLTPQQRAAIDFNTLLVRAVRKDTASQEEYEPGPGERKVYDRNIKRLFGSTGRDSDELYAPETVAVLRQLDFHDTNADLDDFLQLRTAITEDDLKDIDVRRTNDDVSKIVEDVSKPEDIRVKRALAQSTQEMESKLADGNRMIGSMQTLAANERAFISRRLGGTPDVAKPGVGYGPEKWLDRPGGTPADLNTFYIQAFEQLAGNRKSGVEDGEVLGRVRSILEDHDVPFKDFLDYANDRSSTARQFDQDLGSMQGVKYRSPEEFRKMLGLGKGVRGE